MAGGRLRVHPGTDSSGPRSTVNQIYGGKGKRVSEDRSSQGLCAFSPPPLPPRGSEARGLASRQHGVPFLTHNDPSKAVLWASFLSFHVPVFSMS